MSARTLHAVFEALASTGVKWALIGAAARNAWAPPRLTTDVDVAALVDAEGYAHVVSAFAAIGYRILSAHRSGPDEVVPAVTIFRNDTVPAPVRQVDLLAAGTDFETEAIENAVERTVAGRAARVIQREDLIVYKLIAWRPRDRQDIADVLATAAAAGVELDLERIREWADVWEVSDRLDVALEAITY